MTEKVWQQEQEAGWSRFTLTQEVGLGSESAKPSPE